MIIKLRWFIKKISPSDYLCITLRELRGRYLGFWNCFGWLQFRSSTGLCLKVSSAETGVLFHNSLTCHKCGLIWKNSYLFSSISYWFSPQSSHRCQIDRSIAWSNSLQDCSRRWRGKTEENRFIFCLALGFNFQCITWGKFYPFPNEVTFELCEFSCSYFPTTVRRIGPVLICWSLRLPETGNGAHAEETPPYHVLLTRLLENAASRET